MITAIALLNVERKSINRIAELLASMENISEVYSVTGNYDLVAIVRVRDSDDLATLMTEQLAGVEGIEKSDTMLAFKAYSRHDLESMFSI